MNTKQSAILNPRITRKTDKITETYFQHLSLFLLLFFFSYNNKKKKLTMFSGNTVPFGTLPSLCSGHLQIRSKTKSVIFFFCLSTFVLSAITIKALLSNYINLTVSRHVKYSFCMHLFKKRYYMYNCTA